MWVNGTPNVPKLDASGGINISKSIEGGSMKLTTLVDYIIYYIICVQSRGHISVMNVFYLFVVIIIIII